MIRKSEFVAKTQFFADYRCRVQNVSNVIDLYHNKKTGSQSVNQRSGYIGLREDSPRNF